MNEVPTSPLDPLGETSLRLPNGLTVIGPASSKGDIQYLYGEIFESRCYEQHGIALAQDATVIDVGANIGLFALRVTQLAPAATVHCFEPAPPTYACLTRNVARYERVHTYNAALMANARDIALTFYPLTPGNSTLFPDRKNCEVEHFAQHATLQQVWHLNKLACIVLALFYPVRRKLARRIFQHMFSGTRTYDCAATTLDRLFESQGWSRVDLLKVDVEGAEQDVFDGLSDTNLARVQQLVLEVSPAKKPWLASFEERLARAGFNQITLQSIVPGGEPRTDVFPCNVYARRVTNADRTAN